METIRLIIEVVLRPTRAFENIRNGKSAREVYIVFCIGAILTFLKSFLMKKHTMTFFEDNRINAIFTLLSIPQLQWGIMYVSYFVFIGVIFFISNKLNKQAKFKNSTLVLMSISSIGCIAQPVFYIVLFVLPREVVHFANLMVCLWALFLSLLAVKTIQDVSFLRAAAWLFIVAVPLIFLFRFPGVLPYLAWLSE